MSEEDIVITALRSFWEFKLCMEENRWVSKSKHSLHKTNWEIRAKQTTCILTK